MITYSVGQVARILRVDRHTVRRLFDGGWLKGYRIPGTQDRRIPKEYLEKFMKDHELFEIGLSLEDAQREDRPRLLAVTGNSELLSSLDHFAHNRRYRLVQCSSPLVAGMSAVQGSVGNLRFPRKLTLAFCTGVIEGGEVSQKDFDQTFGDPGAAVPVDTVVLGSDVTRSNTEHVCTALLTNRQLQKSTLLAVISQMATPADSLLKLCDSSRAKIMREPCGDEAIFRKVQALLSV